MDSIIWTTAFIPVSSSIKQSSLSPKTSFKLAVPAEVLSGNGNPSQLPSSSLLTYNLPSIISSATTCPKPLVLPPIFIQIHLENVPFFIHVGCTILVPKSIQPHFFLLRTFPLFWFVLSLPKIAALCNPSADSTGTALKDFIILSVSGFNS